MYSGSKITIGLFFPHETRLNSPISHAPISGASPSGLVGTAGPVFPQGLSSLQPSVRSHLNTVFRLLGPCYSCQQWPISTVHSRNPKIPVILASDSVRNRVTSSSTNPTNLRPAVLGYPLGNCWGLRWGGGYTDADKNKCVLRAENALCIGP